MWCKLAVLLYIVALSNAAVKRDAASEVHERFANFRDNCFPRGSGQGCRCTSTINGKEETKLFETSAECNKPTVAITAENKANLNKEFKEKFAGLRENCFPRPSSGCRCTEKNENGEEVTKNYDSMAECGVQHDPAAIEAKKELNKELKETFAGLKENCYPRPGKGCRCVEKQTDGTEQTKLYDTESECKIKSRRKRDVNRDNSRSSSPVSQNVRDPVREKAQQNYQAVLNELKDKFRGLKEGCYPRPKGCLCVIGKDNDGRDRTERRMKDSDCKCQPGETGQGCPAAGA
jgi:hypothetical protein